MLPPEVEAVAVEVAGQPLEARLDAISRVFLGRGYLEGAEGEGTGPDPDPPARYDLFDCLTFIEEVLALAWAPSPAWTATVRNQLRYRDGVVSYETRRHFFEAEWIPENIANGFLTDITGDVGNAVLMEKPLTADLWRRWRRRKLFDLPDERFPVGTLRLPVLDLLEAERAVDRIPPGTLVVTVRQSLPHLPIVVTHVGLTVEGPEPTMRHATRMSSRRVRDDRLLWYIQHLATYTNWPVAGVNLLLPLEQGPRRGATPWVPPSRVDDGVLDGSERAGQGEATVVQ